MEEERGRERGEGKGRERKGGGGRGREKEGEGGGGRGKGGGRKGKGRGKGEGGGGRGGVGWWSRAGEGERGKTEGSSEYLTKARILVTWAFLIRKLAEVLYTSRSIAISSVVISFCIPE